VFVFTPKGDVFGLPNGATPIDFAYRVHTEVGHRSTGAKVNGKIVPLDYELRNGDIVDVLTGKKERPSKDWVRMVKTAGARVKIRNWFKKHK
ncbi:MAG: TGS domain-containing protein, partial [bacterium]